MCPFYIDFANRFNEISDGWLFYFSREEVFAFYFTDTPELQDFEREMQKVPNFDRYDDDDEYEMPKEYNSKKKNSYGKKQRED